MRVHKRDSEVLIKDIKRCKVIGGGTESSLVRHGTFGFSKCSEPCELNSARFSSCCFFFSLRGLALGLHVFERVGRPVLEGCGRLLRLVQSWEPHVSRESVGAKPP